MKTLICIFCLLVTNSAFGLTIGEFLMFQNSKGLEHRSHLSSVYTGFYVYNQSVDKKHKSFCIPEFEIVSPYDLIKEAIDDLFKKDMLDTETINTSIEPLLLVKLSFMYPCGKK